MSDIGQTEVCLCRGLYTILHVRQFGGYRPIYTFQKLCPLALIFGEKPFLTYSSICNLEVKSQFPWYIIIAPEDGATHTLKE